MLTTLLTTLTLSHTGKDNWRADERGAGSLESSRTISGMTGGLSIKAITVYVFYKCVYIYVYTCTDIRQLLLFVLVLLLLQSSEETSRALYNIVLFVFYKSINYYLLYTVETIFFLILSFAPTHFVSCSANCPSKCWRRKQ